MEQIILDIINQFGYIGIAALIAIENIFPPIPSEVILTFGGFLTTKTTMNVFGVIMASTIGALIGAVVLYYIGYILNVDRLTKFLDSKLAKVLRLKKKDIDKANHWFVKYNTKAVFFGRFIPVVRSLISIPAGMSKMKLVPFIIYTTIGSLIWNTVLVLLGAVTGKNWNTIVDKFALYSDIVLYVLIIGFIVGIISYYRNRK